MIISALISQWKWNSSHSMLRQIDDCANNVSEFIQGTRLVVIKWWSCNKKILRNVVWEYDHDAERPTSNRPTHIH